MYDVSTSAYVKVTSDLLTTEEGLRVAVAHHDGDETEHEERVPEELFDALLHLLLQPPLLLHLLPLLARRFVYSNNQPAPVTSCGNVIIRIALTIRTCIASVY